jgi:hypothetical protein
MLNGQITDASTAKSLMRHQNVSHSFAEFQVDLGALESSTS